MSEKIIYLPLFDQAAVDIREKGSFKTTLNADQLKSIMNDVIRELMKGTAVVKAEITEMKVVIKNKIGGMAIRVVIDRPISAVISIQCNLGNNEENAEKIKFSGMRFAQDIDKIDETFLELKGIDLEKQMRQALEDPNTILLSALRSQLESKGVNVTGVNLQFSESALEVALVGQGK